MMILPVVRPSAIRWIVGLVGVWLSATQLCWANDATESAVEVESVGLAPEVTGHSLWEINARCAAKDLGSACRSAQLAAFQHRDCGWQQSSEAQLLVDIETQPARTIIYVHGNRTSLDEARRRSLAVFRALCERADRPVRLISFTWPSEKPHRVLPSHLIAEKKELITAAGFQLANFMGRLPEGEIKAILGFSFGCAVVTTALQLHAGGAVACHTLCMPGNTSGGLRVGLVAAALDRNALTACGESSHAARLIDQLVNLYNSTDPVLRRFRFFDAYKPEAAGFAGFRTSPLLGETAAPQFVQVDCRVIGKSHAEQDYWRCSAYCLLLDSLLGY